MNYVQVIYICNAVFIKFIYRIVVTVFRVVLVWEYLCKMIDFTISIIKYIIVILIHQVEKWKIVEKREMNKTKDYSRTTYNDLERIVLKIKIGS